MENLIKVSEVVNKLRFEVLGKVYYPTSNEFNALPVEERIELYKKMFESHYTTCEILSSLDKLFKLLCD